MQNIRLNYTTQEDTDARGAFITHFSNFFKKQNWQ